MPKTPVPDAPLELERLRVAAAVQHARRALVARPPLIALDLVQGVLMPLLSSLGVDVFDLESLRLTGEATARRAEYRLQRESTQVNFVIVASDSPLPQAAAEEGSTTILSNGRQWRVSGSERGEFELFDEDFPQALSRLLDGPQTTPQAAKRTSTPEAEEGVDTGEKSPPRRPRQKEFVRAGPFERITLEEVRGHAEAVRNMRGKLQVWFDGEQVDVTSRSAFYYLLAELALRHGREDAIPGEDLVLPPDQPPPDRRAKPLARPGWQLLVDHDPESVEERTLSLLEALGLVRHFSATQRGRPYPPQSE